MSDYISEDALIQILKYLPARNLVRLRSVCKSWKELIDSDEFMLNHLTLQKPSFLVKYEATEFVAVELGCQPLTHPVRCPIQGGKISCNSTHHGIVLLDDGDRNVSLWNPSTGKLLSILLPVGFCIENLSEDRWGCCKSFFIDPLTKEYQIVILYYYDVWEDHVPVNGILYSSIEKGWSGIPEQEIKRGWFFKHRLHSLFVEGVAYWTDELREAALSFDFSKKTIELISLPCMNYITGSLEFGDTIQLIQWKGAFSILCDVANLYDTFEIHTRTTEGSWRSMFRFSIPTLEFPLCLLAVAETDQRFWVLYETKNDLMREQSEERKMGKQTGIPFYYHDLYLYQSGAGCTLLTSGDYPPIAHDFVEILLFPLT